ncbi:TetR/AcrR family transcriptional regulator [Actinokineospora guangxiensis]|uniref:TetR/AcrR family transcriptional regulator n=1 Tax=Actinokineospora guangxiensis TaxID=1490288 RepID=A0ABW0ERL9_9PSEU
MVVYAGQGDPARSIPLLWRAPAEPKPGLSVDAVVDAGIEVADSAGLAALSMRAVGERLGVTAMALYTHVPGKGELLELMYDRALARLPTHYPQEMQWREALTTWADDTVAFHLRHPWLLHISQARPVLGPHEFQSLETLSELVRRTGLPPKSARGAVTTLTNYTRGAAQTIADARAAAAATGQSDDEWWFSRSPLLDDVAHDFSTRYENLLWLESDPEPQPEDCTPYLEWQARRSFHTGLEILLDGIEAAQNRATPAEAN